MLQCNVNPLRQTRTVSKVNNKFAQLKIDLNAASIPIPDAVEAESLFICVTEIILVLVII